MRIRILTGASENLQKGKEFYDGQTAGLGSYFLNSLYSDIDSLIIYAGIHRKINGYHCMLSKRFPYAIYYKVESDEIKIYRVLDCRQDPQKTIQALT